MADKYEYWRELFGEDFPEELLKSSVPVRDDTPEETGKTEKSADIPQKKAESPIIAELNKVFGVAVSAPSKDSAKWAYFGGGEPEDDSDIWFDAPEGGGKPETPVKAEAKKPAEAPQPEDPLQSTNIVPDDMKTVTGSSKKNGKPKTPVEEPTRLVEKMEDVSAKPEAPIKKKKTRAEKFVVRGRRKKFGCLGGFMYFAFVAGISILLTMLLWLGVCDVLALNKNNTTAVITVEKDFTVKQVAKQLHDEGIIKYEFLFNLFGKFSHAQDKIDPGTYELSGQYDYRALIVKMQAGAGSQLTTDVTIPEGYTVEQIFKLLDEKNVCDYDTLMKTAAEYDFKHTFLRDIPLGKATRLEGYIFPDTYQFFVDDDPVGVINRMLNNFDDKFNDEMRQAAEERGLSLHDIVIIASLIEKEAANDKERDDIASVIFNRLNNWDVPVLQIDASIQYILPERKENLLNSDLEIDSPYNTYKYPGLPAGPIANPGLASLKAAVAPADTNYYYYALGKENAHEFFSSYDSFSSFINSEQFGG